jgi:ABC-type transporter Mla subunit MlaD
MESSTRQGSGSTKPVGEQAGQVANDMKQQASQVKDQVTQQAESKLDNQKHKVASQISSLASALDDASSTMRDSNPQMAHFAESAVDRLNQWSTQLERKDFGELVDDVESFARRNPALFVGGAFALGLLGARFLKSSAPQSNLARQYQSRYQPTQGTTTPAAGATRRPAPAWIGRATARRCARRPATTREPVAAARQVRPPRPAPRLAITPAPAVRRTSQPATTPGRAAR